MIAKVTITVSSSLNFEANIAIYACTVKKAGLRIKRLIVHSILLAIVKSLLKHI